MEHDHETIESADYIVELGPKAGNDGGKVVATGTVASIKNIRPEIRKQMAEIIDSIAKHFPLLDDNKDGKLSYRELDNMSHNDQYYGISLDDIAIQLTKKASSNK